MISAIEFSAFSNRFSIPDEYFNFLYGLKQMNVFVGPNNSGKSIFLRTILNNIGKFKTIETDIKNDNKNFKGFYTTIGNQINNEKIEFPGIDEFFSLKEKITSSEFVDIDSILKISYLCRNIDKTIISSLNTQVRNGRLLIKEFTKKVSDISQHGINFLNQISHVSVKKYLYIPILRGLRPIEHFDENGGKFSNKDLYEIRTRFDYFKNDNINLLTQNFEIKSGLSIYDDVRKLLLGDEKDRKLISEFEDFLSNEIFEKKITLIPKHDEDVLNIKVGNDPQIPIFNLGDGLQTIICILFPVFERKDKQCLTIIEEPESHLHASWQAKLINTLKTFKNHQFFISTHSSSFINSEDVSIYKVSKKDDQKISINYVQQESSKVEILKDLGIKPSDLFLTNYIIWVEGPSDKIYLNYWLKEMAPDLKEAQHYSILFFGGETYRHLLNENEGYNFDLLMPINKNFGIILDSDRTKSSSELDKKKQVIKEMFEKNESFCWITDYRTIENYIPKEIFILSVEKVHPDKEIAIDNNHFFNRCILVDKNSSGNIKCNIKIPEALFSKIQKYKGNLNKIDAEEIKNQIQEALNQTKKNTSKIDKVWVAKEIIKNTPDIEIPELKEKLNELILKIREANDMETKLTNKESFIK